MRQSELQAKRAKKDSTGENSFLDRFLQNEEMRRSLDKITDSAELAIVIHTLEKMEYQTIRMIQVAVSDEERLQCQVWSQVMGMLIKKLKRANKVKKEAVKIEQSQRVQALMEKQMEENLTNGV